MPPRTTDALSPARIVVFTADASITADLPIDGQRVKDVLNEAGAFLTLSRLTYSNPDRPGVALVDYPSGVLRKADIGCVVVLTEPATPPMRRMGVYVQKTPVRVSMMIPGMVVVGSLHIQGRYDPALILTDGQEAFVPLTEAGVVRARTTTPTAVPPERLTVFVNRRHIAGILLTESVELVPAGLDPVRTRLQPPGTANLTPPISETPPQTGRLRRLVTSELGR